MVHHGFNSIDDAFFIKLKANIFRVELTLICYSGLKTEFLFSGLEVSVRLRVC